MNQFHENSSPNVESLTDALAGFGASIQALGELRTYFDKLAKVAPSEIQSEVEIVATEYGKQLDSASDAANHPLGAIASGLFGSITMSGPLNSVDTFARQNCGEGI